MTNSFATPMDCSPPGSSVHGISQARILEWVAISFSGDLPHPGTEPAAPALAGRFLPLAGGFFYHLCKVMWCAVLLLCLVTQTCLTLRDPTDCSPPGSSIHGDSPGKNTVVGCQALLQGIFPTQGLNPGLLCCRQISLPSEPPGSPQEI